MTASRTRRWAVLAVLLAPISAAGATPVGQMRPLPKAVAAHPLMVANASGKLRVPTPALAANGAAQPFVLNASAHDRALAERCLTQAVYYEAGRQPLEGREAVAQTVINRLRHPDYPKSVCGVVYEGSDLRTGCQFSFTCDGSLRRTPDPELWNEAEAVARQALSGFVMTKIGEATYYHADYVRPFWAGALKRITQIGAHIFYRWPGPSGDASAFTGQYAGGEADIAAVGRATDPRLATLRPAELRHAVPYRPTLVQAVQRTPVPPKLRMIEASYVTTDRRRVMSVIRPAVARAAPPAESPPSAPLPYAALAGHAAAPALAIATAKVTLPPVHATVIATAAPAIAAAARQ